MKPSDRVRINVAIVGGKGCMHGRARGFDDRSLADMIGNGFISDGDFASMPSNVFVHHNAAIKFAGRETQDGRALLRYDLKSPSFRSGWHVRLRNASGIVGVKGWFLADANTLDLVRFVFAAQDLPPFSPETPP